MKWESDIKNTTEGSTSDSRGTGLQHVVNTWSHTELLHYKLLCVLIILDKYSMLETKVVTFLVSLTKTITTKRKLQL